MNVERAAKILGLSEEATEKEVKERFREYAMEHHPDRGGTQEQFIVGRIAFEVMEKYASQPKKCFNCHGTGKMKVGRTQLKLQILCSFCRGSGKARG